MGQFAAIYISFPENTVSEVEQFAGKLKEAGYLFIVRYQKDFAWIQLHVDEVDNIAYYTAQKRRFFLSV